ARTRKTSEEFLGTFFEEPPWPRLSELTAVVNGARMDADALRSAFHVQNAQLVLGARRHTFRQLLLRRLTDATQQPHDDLLAVSLDQERSPAALASDGVDEQIAETNLDRRMHMDLRLFDKGQSRAPFERSDDDWKDLRDAGADFRREDEGASAGIE